jgi:MFS superfamily sulfate permease-like transporter
MKNFFSHWRNDLPSSLVVFLVALPLCLGVALASTGAKPILFSGIIAGVVGGVVVGFFSSSKLGVSGPAAGLITIVLAAITTLGSFESFLVAVILAGFIQLIAGFIGAGVLGNFFPSSVIKGMLAAIGLTLILKEIPHLVGYDKDFMGDESFFQFDGHNTFSDLIYATNALSPGAMIIAAISIFYILRKNLRNNFQKKLISNEGSETLEIILSEEVTFLNKGSIIELIQNVPNNSTLIIDGSKSKAIDYDVLELIQEFKVHGAKTKNIILKTINIPEVKISGSH